MPGTKPKKSPAAVPFNQFMGKYAGAIRAGLAADEAAEQRRKIGISLAELIASKEKGDTNHRDRSFRTCFGTKS